jgi:hypothetical protein
MRPKLYVTFFLLILLYAKPSFGQREGVFMAPTILTGYSSITGVYHTNPEYAPANKGFNLAFQYGATAGYKLEKWGLAAEFKNCHYQQNFNEINLSGYLKSTYLSYGGSLFYQFERLQSSRHYHTAYLGYLLNVPQSAAYYVNDNVDATVYSNIDALYQLQNDNMITAGYGITTGYKLLWAEFSVRLGYSLGNIYKPLTGASGKNFFIGFGLSFGLFVNTTK